MIEPHLLSQDQGSIEKRIDTAFFWILPKFQGISLLTETCINVCFLQIGSIRSGEGDFMPLLNNLKRIQTSDCLFFEYKNLRCKVPEAWHGNRVYIGI